jgi:hypothetical protein
MLLVFKEPAGNEFVIKFIFLVLSKLVEIGNNFLAIPEYAQRFYLLNLGCKRS